MGCGCRKDKPTPASRGTNSSDLSKFAYLTPRQLRIKKEQEEKALAEKEDK